MIKTTIKDILMSSTVIAEIMEQKVDGKTASRVARFFTQMVKDFNPYNEQYNNFVKECNQKYGKVPEQLEGLNQELNSFLKTEVEIHSEGLKPEDIEAFELTPRNVLTLMKFIKE